MIRIKKAGQADDSGYRPLEEEPVSVEEEGPVGGTKTTHPCFGQIVASRVSGNANLYDSEFKHQHYVSITITRSQHHRSLSRNWLFGRGELIRVSMSEAQWVSFISTMNVGSGTACTLERIQGQQVPNLPAPMRDKEKFKQEVVKDFAEAKQRHKEMVALINNTPMSGKKRDEMIMAAEMAYARIQSSLEFVADQFGEHMETTTSKAKAEIEGFFTGILMRLGIKAMKDSERPFLIEEDKKGAIDKP